MAPSSQYDQEASKPADKVRVIVSMSMIWNLQYDYIFLSPFSFFSWPSLLKLDQGVLLLVLVPPSPHSYFCSLTYGSWNIMILVHSETHTCWKFCLLVFLSSCTIVYLKMIFLCMNIWWCVFSIKNNDGFIHCSSVFYSMQIARHLILTI